MELKIDNIQDIIELCKSIKSDIICIQNNYIYGTDLGFNYLKILEFDNINNISLNFVYKDFIKICKNQESIHITRKSNNNDIIRLSQSCVTSEGTCDVNSMHIYMNMNNLINNTFTILNKPVTHINENLKDNVEFSKSLDMKAGNGISLVREIGCNNEVYILTLFKNLVPVNKTDKVKLEIIDLDTTFLAHYIIYKKKLIIHEYIQYLKLH